MNLSVFNPFKKSASDYDSTDLIFSKFKDQINYDDRILIVNSGKPNRSEIAHAIRLLDSLNAKTIGVDIIFERPVSTKVDSSLAQTILSLNNIVIADRFIANKEQALPHECSFDFCVNNFGFTNFVAKPDHSIRFYSPFIMHNGKQYDAFSSAILAKSFPEQYASLKKRQNQVERIHYRGAEDSFTQIEIEDLLSEPLSKVIIRYQ